MQTASEEIGEVLRCVLCEIDNDANEKLVTGDSNINIKVLDHSIDNDTVNLSNNSQIPAEILVHYLSTESYCKYGLLSSLAKYYCIIDNKLFIWPAESCKVTSHLLESEATIIQSVCECSIVFDQNTEIPCLAIATPKYIKIISTENGQLNFSKYTIIGVPFKTSILSTGPAGYIFAGSYSGDVYIIDICMDCTYWNGTTGLIKRLGKYLIGYIGSPIVGIATDNTKTNIAYWNRDNEVYFLTFDPVDERFQLKSSYKSSTEKIISVSSQGNLIYEVFTENSKILIFGPKGSYSETPNDELDIESIRKLQTISVDNTNIGEKKLIDASSQMGCATLLYKDSAIFIRKINKSQNSPRFSTCLVKLPGTPIFTDFGVRFSSPQISNALKWQHTALGPTCFIFTNEGALTFDFAQPAVSIGRKALTSTEDFLGDVEIDGGILEVLSSLVLLCETDPAHTNQYIAAAKLISKNDELVQAITIRLARLLAKVANLPVMEQVDRVNQPRKTKFRICRQFAMLPVGLPLQIAGVERTIKAAIEYGRAFMEPNESERTTGTHIALKQLLKFTEFIRETLYVICTLAQQKSSLFTKPIEDNEKESERDYNLENAVVYLMNTAYLGGSGASHVNGLIENLRTLTEVFVRTATGSPETDALCARITENAPHIINFAQRHMQTALDTILCAKFASGPDQLQMLQLEINAILENIGSPVIRLEQLCSMLRDMGQPGLTYKLATARAKFIDPNGRVLRWMKKGEKESDVVSARLAEKVMECYDACVESIECKNGLEEAMPYAEENELFARVIFKYVCVRGEVDRLIDIGGPAVERFIMDEYPEKLWHAYLKAGKKKEAVDILFKLASEASTDIGQRISWLSTARTIQRQLKPEDRPAGLDDCYNTALAQQELEYELNKAFNKLLMPVDLAKEAINAWAEADNDAKPIYALEVVGNLFETVPKVRENDDLKKSLKSAMPSYPEYYQKQMAKFL